MERTHRSAYQVMMEHVAVGDIAACICVIDPKDGEKSIFVSAVELPVELSDDVDGVAAAVLAIRYAHQVAANMGMEPVY